MSKRPVVAIVGGGLAGLSAAWALSEFPVDVKLLEARSVVGGRAGSYTDSTNGGEVDYCQHVAMGCCTNFLWWMQETDLLQHFQQASALTFLAADVPSSILQSSRWLPAPLHSLPAFARAHFLSRAQKIEIARGLWRLMRRSSRSRETTSMQQWLRTAGQSEETIERFWEIIIVSALGESTQRVSVDAARKVLVDGFLGHREAGDVWIPQCSLSDLFGRKLADKLLQRGVSVECGSPVKNLECNHNTCVDIQTSESSIQADQAIIAVPWHGLSRLLPPQSNILPAAKLQAIHALPSSPISGVHLWFDRAITNKQHCVLVGGLAQWLFRPAFGNESEHYYQVVISASRDVRAMPRDKCIEQILAEIETHFPDATNAKLLRSKTITDRQAVFSMRPEIETIRPHVQTQHPSVQLAGDYTATDWPATMEGAVLSGFRAADQVLQGLGLGRFAEQPPLPRNLLTKWVIRE
ncbi:15-cis-phytoene desaturase [Roseimaritima multifibrata]|uniref:15-cis-phytoene desaturase n=1 Tax=Roseimaritima multifibrata TaxID=1930274 RepID=A0A517MMN8_9BACT|nr:hydroxysqualene dehydroxylase HpnE [Roseimaritima multifibrata]QDS96142.1 15-cis-phytoene desaturase [Roseimaritima multifibrata]